VWLQFVLYLLLADGPLPLLEFEEQLVNQVDLQQVDESSLQRRRQLGEVAVEKTQIGVATDTREEIVLHHLVIDRRSLLLQLKSHERSYERDPEPLPKPDAETARCLSPQSANKPRLVGASFGEVVDHAPGERADLDEDMFTSMVI
jgi:hypothetical protein